MYAVIKKFFALYHYLSLPGIGSFLVETQPAQINFTNRNITPAKNTIVFNNDKLQPEKRFYEFISRELNVDEVHAIRSFTDYTSTLQEDLQKHNVVYLKGIGTLTKHTSNVYTFQPEEMPEYFPVLTAERIIRKNASHTVRVGENERTSEEMQTALNKPKKIKRERWWIAATILGVIGIAAIIFYYTMPG